MALYFLDYKDYLNTLKKNIETGTLESFYKTKSELLDRTAGTLRTNSEVSFVDVFSDEELKHVLKVAPNALGPFTTTDVYRAVVTDRYWLVKQIISKGWFIEKPKLNSASLVLPDDKALELLKIVADHSIGSVHSSTLEAIASLVSDKAFTKIDLETAILLTKRVFHLINSHSHPNIFRMLTISPAGAELFHPERSVLKHGRDTFKFEFLAIVATGLTPENFLKAVEYTKKDHSSMSAALLFCPLVSKYPKVKKRCLKALLNLKSIANINELPKGVKLSVEKHLVEALSKDEYLTLLSHLNKDENGVISADVDALHEKASLLAVTNPEVLPTLDYYKPMLKALANGVVTARELRKLMSSLRALSSEEQLALIERILKGDCNTTHKINLIKAIVNYEVPNLVAPYHIAECERNYGEVKHLIIQLNQELKQKRKVAGVENNNSEEV